MEKFIILGAGNMGLALASGIAKENIINFNDIVLVENNEDRFNSLKKTKWKKNLFNTVEDAFNLYKSNVTAILLAVKPKDIPDLLKDLSGIVNKKSIIISIAAGTKIKNISSYFQDNQPVVRVMPNTPSQISQGVSVICFNNNFSKVQKSFIKKMFQSVGSIVELDESKFDIVTALSGSGPAYFCYMVENMIKAGVKSGLDKKIAEKLIVETLIGTGNLILKQNLPPEVLRSYVTSPKGTTEAAISIFEKNNMDKIIFNAIISAKNRSIELGKRG